MTKNKLKLKRTPEEEQEHQLKKERRREKKRKREARYGNNSGSGSKRAHLEEEEYPHRKWASSDDDDEEYGPQPASASTSHKTDYDTLKAEIEEQMFRQKMFDALEDDERLDSVEARFNDFAQVPERWRTMGTGSSRLKMDEDEFMKMDPSMLDDEEYAEWVRAGMYRKTHAEEYAEQQRKKAAHEARKAERKARKAETAQLERQAEEERKRKKAERQSRKMEDARVLYHARWAALLTPTSENSKAMLSFDDIPWPIFSAYTEKSRRDDTTTDSVTVEDMTMEAVSSFLLPPSYAELSADDETQRKKERKDKLRETFLRFHPDKFEGRFKDRIKIEDVFKVSEGIGQISRILNRLMNE